MAYNTNIFRRAFEAIEENLLKVDRFNGKIVGGFYRSDTELQELVKIYGDFPNGRGSCFELAMLNMATADKTGIGQYSELITFNCRYLHSYRPKSDGEYKTSSQEEFNTICHGVLLVFRNAISGSTGETKWYNIEPLDRNTVEFIGGENFNIADLSLAGETMPVHSMKFQLKIILEST